MGIEWLRTATSTSGTASGNVFLPTNANSVRMATILNSDSPTKMTGRSTDSVEVRPQQYGIAGIRSYLAVATIDRRTSRHSLHIYATQQDRSATMADPLTQP